MKTIHLPSPRKTNVLRWLWLAPTNLIGRAFARLVGCEPAQFVGAPGAPARLCLLPPGRLVGLGAVALGHVIVAEHHYMEGKRGPWVLAHELSHTRQHDYLGPFYLPVHGILQLVSSLLFLLRPIPRYPPMHAYNPLERAFLCVPFDLLADGWELEDQDHEVLRAFGLQKWCEQSLGRSP